MGRRVVGAEGGAGCHGADGDEDYVGGFDVDNAWGAPHVEVDLLCGNFWGVGE